MADTHETLTVSPSVVSLTSWQAVLAELGTFPSSKLLFTPDGNLTDTRWIFRGVTNSEYTLEPTIERYADARFGWAVLEAKVSEEFKYRAHVHSDRPLAMNDEFTWLAFMQHHGVPTRLLDFTHSPFVALYFAVRGCSRTCRTVRVWAVDSEVINSRCAEVVALARKCEQEEGRFCVVSMNPATFYTARDLVKDEASEMQRRAKEVLEARGYFRSELNARGCVCVALPPSFSPRLANQQGLFLINGAEESSLESSLVKMMDGKTDWCKAFDIPVQLADEIEERLFQMNIHEQLLFPDTYGLAGLIKQRIRLHWA